MRPSSCFAVACVLLAAAPARAAWRDISAADFQVSPPPAAGSAEDKADMAAILDWQQKRAPQQCTLAQGMTRPDFLSLFTPSSLLSQDELTRVEPFLDAVSQAVSNVTGIFKKRYARPRPYNEDPRVVPCADKPGGATSYPSSHAAEGAVDACVLDVIFPERSAKLDAWGAYVGQLRVIAGVHHPTDVVAGQKLAGDVCSWLKAQPDFVSEAAALRAP